jgi:malonate decarboxylase beta subunit
MTSFLESSARGRIAGLVDPGSFVEFLAPPERRCSPHLAALGVPVAFDDGIVIGSAALSEQRVLIAAQEGRFMGGAVGEVHGAKLAGLLRLALAERTPVVLLPDTGGVRLHEANAGLIAVGEIQRAMLDLRIAGVVVVAAIGSSNGCYGGVAIAMRSCDWIVMSEEGRLSVSGPEVIETASGIEEFDAQDRALVWRTMGGKHRVLIGEADILVEDDLAAFRDAVLPLLERPRGLDLATMREEHALLSERINRLGGCRDGRDAWAALGVKEPSRVPDMTANAFNNMVARL